MMTPLVTNRLSAHRPVPRRSGAAVLMSVLVLTAALGAPARAGSIFDDDWAAAPRVQPAPLTKPVTPAPATPAPRPPATTPPAPTPVAPAPAASGSRRRPVPVAAELNKSRQLMKDVFSKELADRSPVAREALARRLLEEAPKVNAVPSDQFVVLGGAIQSALEAGDLPLALDAADRMAAAYDLDALALKASVATKMTAGGYAGGAAANVPAAIDLLKTMEAAEDYAGASRLVSLLQQVPLNDPSLRASVIKGAKDLEEMRAARERLGSALEKLKTAPDDPAANAAVGRYRALLRGDWEHGLPLLAKGDDPKLAAQAKSALANPSDPAARARLADGWWDMAQAAAGLAKANLLDRSAADYRLALPGLAGLTKTLAEKRLAEVEAQGAAAAGAATVGGAAATAARPGTPVHLLPLVLDKDLARVRWRRMGAAVVSEGENATCLTLPYAPGEEYDFSAEFARLNGDGEAALAFPFGVGAGDFVVGAVHNHVAFLGRVGGKWYEGGNPTVTDGGVKNKERHRIEVKVRQDSVSGYLDGNRLCDRQRKAGEDDVGLRELTPRSPGLLGIGSWKSEVAFFDLVVTPVHGAGAVARERDAEGWIYNPTVVRPSADGGAVRLSARDATVHGKELCLDNETDSPMPPYLARWTNTDEYLTWFVEAPKPGDYAVEVTYACVDGGGGADVEVALDGGRGAPPLTLRVRGTGGWQQFRPESLGTLRLHAGKQTLSLKAKSKPHHGVMNLQQVVLTPVR